MTVRCAFTDRKGSRCGLPVGDDPERLPHVIAQSGGEVLKSRPTRVGRATA